MNSEVKRLVLLGAAALLFAVVGCPLTPPVTPTPVPGSGGSAPTPIAGAPSFSGAPSGGSEAIQWPPCNPASKAAVPGQRYPLGRLVTSTPSRDRGLLAYVPDMTAPSVFWMPLLDHALTQRRGSCTGNAPVTVRLSVPYLVDTLPEPWRRETDIERFEDLAESVYSEATRTDPFAGEWPPDDTGSTTLDGMRAAARQGLYMGWKSIDSFAELQQRLQTHGCVFGSNWYTSMFSPDLCGQVVPSGVIEGGHAYAIVGMQTEKALLWFDNSWGDSFGLQWHGHGGYFTLSFDDFALLWKQGGDVICSEP